MTPSGNASRTSSSSASTSSSSSSSRSSTRDEKRAQTSLSQARQYFLDACQAHTLPANEDFDALLSLPGLTDGVLDLSVTRDSTGGYLARHLSGDMLRALNQYVRDISGEEGIHIVSLPLLNELAGVLRGLGELPRLTHLGVVLSTGPSAPSPDALALLQSLDRCCNVTYAIQRPSGSGEATGDFDDGQWPEGYAFLAGEGFAPAPHLDGLDAFHKVILSSPERFKHLDHCLLREELEDTYAALDTKAAAGAFKATPPWVSHARVTGDLCAEYPHERLHPEHLGAYWLVTERTPMRIFGEEAAFVSVLTDRHGHYHLALQTHGDNPRLDQLNQHVVKRDSADKWQQNGKTGLYVLPLASLAASEVHWLHPGQSARDRALNTLKSCIGIEQRTVVAQGLSPDQLMAATFPALLDDKADHGLVALLGALDLQTGTFDTARLDEPMQVLAHALSDRGWQALDEYAHSFNGLGITAVNLTLQGMLPVGVVRLAALQTLYMPEVLVARLD